MLGQVDLSLPSLIKNGLGWVGLFLADLGWSKLGSADFVGWDNMYSMSCSSVLTLLFNIRYSSVLRYFSV